MEYTKGEWIADIRVGVATVHIKDNQRFICLEGMRNSCIYWSQGNPIEKDGIFDHWEVSPESISNAHLIAAAPEMYGALRQALRTFEARGIKPSDPRYLMLLQAKAKAEGK